VGGVCRNEPKSNRCEVGSMCVAGQGCVESQGCASVADCDDGVDCTEDLCDPFTGSCSNPLLPDDTQCDDSNPCTDDSCVAGFCENNNNTASCNDGDGCTMNDTCSGGSCLGGPPLDADGDSYVSDVCGGDDCNDGNAAVNPGSAEVCDNSIDDDCDGDIDNLDTDCYECFGPADCNDANPCTDDSCVAGFCEYSNNTASCDDGDACTMDDTCSGGSCVGGPPLDADGDSYVSEACGGSDCDDGNSAVNPGAAEVCDNTIDDDCDGAADSLDMDCDPDYLFLAAYLTDDDALMTQFLAQNPNPGLGTDEYVYGAIDGYCHWTITMAFFGGLVTYDYQDYNESGLVMNGIRDGTMNMSGTGDLDGVLDFTGTFEGWIDDHLELVSSNPTYRSWYVCNYNNGCTGSADATFFEMTYP